MDIKQIIKDNLPEGTELTDKTLAAIAKDINKAVGDEHVPKEWLSEKRREWDTEKQELEAKLANSADYDTLKQQLDEERAAHKATRDGYTAEKEAADIDGKVSEALKAAGMNEKAIPKALKLYDRKIVEKDKDGNIKNADKVIESFKTEWADFFGETQTKGAEVGNSSGQTGGQKNPWLKEHRNLAEQTRIYRENPTLAVSMAKQAGVILK